MEIKVPTFPESVTEGTLIAWLVKPGDVVKMDQIIAEVETDKVVFEVPSPVNGRMAEYSIKVDDSVESEQKIAVIEEGDFTVEAEDKEKKAEVVVANEATQPQTSPAVRKILDEKGLQRNDVVGTGKAGRITKSDVLTHQVTVSEHSTASGLEERVPMSRIRKRIAERLLDSVHETAMLTTFNEVNMQSIMDARSRYKELFEKQNNTKLGYMSFFVKAVTQALLRYPDINASIDGDELLYHGYCDVGIAVSTKRGLVVPILRRAENMTFVEIESGISNFAQKAQNNKLNIDDLMGGTFSITNGGVFGSLMSTPIINPPQSAILGMHAIQQRPVVEDGQIVARPMMYLALSYDHRIIDGKTSVTFLRSVKEMLENPVRLIMNI